LELPWSCPPKKVSPDGKGNWTEAVLFDFKRGNGFAVNPSAGLLVDPDGDRFVGTTSQGGDGLGTVFVLNQSKYGAWKQDVLHRFYDNLDGNSPAGQLTRDSHGNLFGVTVVGGGAWPRNGMVFELAIQEKGPWKETIVYDFAGGFAGEAPYAGVVLDNQGHLYGTTAQGGTSLNGTVYEITP
jgi:uncharacterized repeat protein (TIGR03803 family)